MEKKNRKCVLRSKDYGNDTYSTGGASYQSSLGAAKIYNYDELEDWQKHGDCEVIFLDSEKGFALLVKEIENLERQISLEEGRLHTDKKNYRKLRDALPEMTDEYIKQHNKRYNSLIGISEDTKSQIVTEIVEEHESN